MDNCHCEFLESLSFGESELAALDTLLEDRSYVCGAEPTQLDTLVHSAAARSDKRLLRRRPHLKRWYCHLGSFSKTERARFPTAFDSQTGELLHVLVKAYADRQVIGQVAAVI